MVFVFFVVVAGVANMGITTLAFFMVIHQMVYQMMYHQSIFEISVANGRTDVFSNRNDLLSKRTVIELNLGAPKDMVASLILRLITH